MIIIYNINNNVNNNIQQKRNEGVYKRNVPQELLIVKGFFNKAF